MLNLAVKNVSTNSMFVDKIQFENNHPDLLVVQDLNYVIPKTAKPVEEKKRPDQKTVEEVKTSLFTDSSVFQQLDIRSYMYLIKTIDPNYKLDNSKSHELGFITILWRNYFGD